MTTANLEPLLAFIRSHEAPQGYDQIWGGIGKRHYPPRPLTKMTVREILRWQDSIDPLYRSEACGAYQVLEDTLRANVERSGLGIDELFDADAQDRFAAYLIEQRGLSKFLADHMTAEQFANSLAREWASLPVVTPVRRTDRSTGRTWVVQPGQSYYSGDGLNKALTKSEEFLRIVRSVKSSAPEKSAPARRPDIAPTAGVIAAVLAALAAVWAYFGG